jgi:hypothetical protein
MAKLISYDDVTPVTGTAFAHCVEASDLGLRPGEWPETLQVERKFGNGLSLYRHRVITHGGELGAVVYRQTGGVLEVHVLND